ncbi:MAG: hypothetical protein AAGD13_09625 [Pseudomonadota bacterium]
MHHEAVQKRLNDLESGIDIVDVIFEAVHPPIDTAATFHRVHGAEKDSAVLENIARAAAEQRKATSQQRRSMIRPRRTASATRPARAERIAFAAERRAYDEEEDVFSFERSLQAFERTFADKNLIIVDPEIDAGQGFVVDLNEQSQRARLPE